jgi:uncharacterized protein (DUF4415 family)
MSVPSTNRSSKSDWARVDALTDDTIDTSDIPPLTEAHFTRAAVRMPRRSAPVTVHVDADVLTWFKAQGDGWEQRVNAALRIYAEAHKAAAQSQPRTAPT